MDPQNEITPRGQAAAGILLIIFIIVPLIIIFGLWPDKISENNASTTYSLSLFHVKLQQADAVKTDTAKKTLTITKVAVKDTTTTTQKNDSPAVKKIPEVKPAVKQNATCSPGDSKRTIDLASLLLILVACGGFLGNMVHVASSFISYVGSGQFKKSWLLWYFVKPFTAAGLAIALYFALRAGFLNSSSGSASINIYGIMIAAILTGLFTDNSTLKLKEIFETIFKPKDDRPDKLTTE